MRKKYFISALIIALSFFLVCIREAESAGTFPENVSPSKLVENDEERDITLQTQNEGKKDGASPGSRVRTVYGDINSAKKYCSGNDGDFISTLGYYEPYDGGGADYILRDSGQENGVTVHKTKNGQYLELVYRDEINVLTAGLVADGEEDNPTDNLKRLSVISDENLFFPDGSYFISGPVKISKAVTWRGLHGKRNASRAVLVCAGSGIEINGRGTTIEELTFRGPKRATGSTAIYVQKRTQYVTLENLDVNGFDYGFYLDNDCWGAALHECSITYNNEGVYLKNDANEVVIRECYFNGNGNGIHTVSSCVHNLVITDCLFQDQKSKGLFVELYTGIEIYCSGCYFENKTGQAVVVGNRDQTDVKINHITFVGNRFYHSVKSDTAISNVQLQNISNAVIVGCSFSRSENATDYIDTHSVDNLYMQGNFFKD